MGGRAADGADRTGDHALVLLAAGAWPPDAIAAGFARVQALKAEMAAGRRRRLARLGFTEEAAAALSKLHTRNFT